MAISSKTRTLDVKPEPVVAAVITNEEKYMICRRPAGKRHGGLWEFPGGKVKQGESFAMALAREIREELDLELVDSGQVLFTAREHNDPFEVHFIEARVIGVPKPTEHSEIRWESTSNLTSMELAPMDAKFVKTILMNESSHV